MSAWHYFFDWYTGQVWPNLVAEVVVVMLTWFLGVRKLVKLHNKHHEELKQHISDQIQAAKDSN
jgi:hypothetical protein